MKVFRLPKTTDPKEPESTAYEAFGRFDSNTIIAPIRLVVNDLVGGVEIENKSRSDGALLGIEVAFTALPVGKISSYRLSAIAITNLKAYVKITLKSGIDVSAWPSAISSPPALIKGGDEVFLETIEANGSTSEISGFRGELIPTDDSSVQNSNLITKQGYFPPSKEGDAYRVLFDNSILGERVGARVIHRRTNTLLGILSTSGSKTALVYPASLIT